MLAFLIRNQKIIMIAVSTVAGLIGVEVILRFTGVFQTISEQRGHGYQSEYITHHEGHFRVYEPNDTIFHTTSEFSYGYPTNNLGLADTVELATDKRIGEYRILVLGDSFTQGVGAPFDSSWVQLFRKRLRNDIQLQGKRLSVLNAGISGSDPFYYLKFLEKHVDDLKPDLTLIMLNTSDVDDVIFRGGNERFLTNGDTRSKRSPWFETLYEHSHVVRLFVHAALDMNYLLVRRKNEQSLRQESMERINCVLLETKEMMDKLESDLVIITLPIADEINNDAYVLGKDSRFFQDLHDNGLKHIDLHSELKLHILNRTFSYYAWPVDKHYKGKGYDLISKFLFDTLSANLEPLRNSKRHTTEQLQREE